MRTVQLCMSRVLRKARRRNAALRPTSTGASTLRDALPAARGSPWSELAKLPPRKYSAPTSIRARATSSAMSIAFSPSSAAIEVDTGEEASGDLAPVEAMGKSRADDGCGRLRVVGPNGDLCQLSNRRAQSGSRRESSERSLCAKQLVVARLGRLRGIAHDDSIATACRQFVANRPIRFGGRARAGPDEPAVRQNDGTCGPWVRENRYQRVMDFAGKRGAWSRPRRSGATPGRSG